MNRTLAGIAPLVMIGFGSVLSPATVAHLQSHNVILRDAPAAAPEQELTSAARHEAAPHATDGSVGHAHPDLCGDDPCTEAPKPRQANSWYVSPNGTPAKARGLSGQARRRGIVKSRHKRRK